MNLRLSIVMIAALVLAPPAGGASSSALPQQIAVGPDFVRIEGATDGSLPAALQSAVGPARRLERVELANDGGDVDGVIAAARWLRRRGVVRAVVIGPCASACAYMALLFPRRDLAPLGLMGFHDVQSGSGDQRAVVAGRLRLLRLLRANGIGRATAQALFSSQYLRWYSRSELLARHLITGCWNSASSLQMPCTAQR